MAGYPERWIVYDCESKKVPDPRRRGSTMEAFRLAVAAVHDPVTYPGIYEFYRELHDPDQFHDMVAELTFSSQPIWIFAHHHGVDSRWIRFFYELSQGRYVLFPPAGIPKHVKYREPLFVIEDLPFLLRLWRPDGQRLMLADTMNWVDKGLAECGEMIGKPKWQMPHRDQPDSDWFDYCFNDVFVTVELLKRIWDWSRSIGVKDWAPTIGSQAFQTYRLKYRRTPISVPEDQSQLALSRHAYYGGRVEAFRLGKIQGPIYQVDVNSMYPSLMLDGLFPTRIVEEQPDVTQVTQGVPPGPIQVCADVYLDSQTTAYPVRCLGGVYYCKGRVRTILCGPELRAACDHGHVTAYGRWTRFNMSRIFTGFMSEFWAVRLAARRSGDKLGDRLAKLFMDSLYGKFAQRDGEWVTCETDHAANEYGAGFAVQPGGEELVDWRVIAGVMQRRLRDRLCDHAFVPISAWVTSYGRVFMDAVRSNLWEPGIYYQATDSLLVDEGNKMLLEANKSIGDGLGQFKLLEEVWEWMDIKALGWIERDGAPMRPGVPASATPHSAAVFEYEKWVAPWTGITQHNLSSVSIKETLTHLKATYPRQEILPSGLLRPWEISNWHMTPEEQRKEKISPHLDSR